jgi:hypothetical protein
MSSTSSSPPTPPLFELSSSPSAQTPDTQTATISHFDSSWTLVRTSDGSVRITSPYGRTDTLLHPDLIPSWPPAENCVVAVNALLRALADEDLNFTLSERSFMEETLLEILAPSPEDVEIITWFEDALGYSRDRVKEAMRQVFFLRRLKVRFRSCCR